MKRTGRKWTSILLSLALMLGLVPGMSLVAYAATTLTSATTTWDAGDYVVPADGVTISDHITVNGTVNLTLTEGSTLTANMGITISDGATLNVSGEGTMVVKGSNENASSTVADSGNLVLTSGTLTATGGNGGNGGYGDSPGGAGGAAISGNVTVNGGTLTATGGNGGNGGQNESPGGAGGAAISGNVTVNGGTLTATGGNGGNSGENESPGGAGGVSYSGTLTLGVGVKLYEGTSNSDTLLDGNDSSSRPYTGEKKQNMYAEAQTHIHDFTYSASGATITATCGNTEDCPLSGNGYKATLTLSAADASFTGSAYAGASLSDTTAWTGAGLTAPTIEYAGRGSTSYTKSTTAPTNVGTYTASITVDTNKTATADFTISPMALTITGATATNRAYANNNTAVTISGVTFKNSSEQAVSLTLGEGNDYTVTGTMADANAGDGKTVNVTVTLVSGNYSLATNTTTTTVNISQATYGNKTVTGSAKKGTSGTVDLSALLVTGYSSATVSDLDGSTILTAKPTIDANKKLNFTFKDEASGSEAVTVTVSSTNYSDYTITATLTATDKDVQTITASDVTATYGDTNKSVSATTTSGGGTVSYAVKSGSDVVDVNASTGALTIRKAGTATVTVTAAETATYAQATKDVTVTIGKATVTVKAKDQSIKVGDAVPTLTDPVLNTHYTVTGLVGEDALGGTLALAYSGTPDNTKTGTYTITPSGATVPNTENYNAEITYQTGTLTISAKQSSGDRDSGSSSTPSTPSTPAADTHISETATAADGAAVTKEVDASTTTKKNSDGSTTVTDTVKETLKTENPDGTKVETATESTKAETTNSVKNSDGSVTDTTKVQNTETVKETATDANGSKTVTETKTEQEQNTAVTTKDNADGSKSEKTETTETVKVTEKVTDGSGKVTETVTTTKTETVTDMTAAQDGTATGTSTTTTTVTDDKGKVLSTTVTEAEIKASTDAEGVVTTETAATTTKTDANGSVTTEQTVTTEAKAPDGSTGTIVKDGEGNVLSQETTISQQEAEKARDEGRPAQSPLKVTPVPETVEDKAAPVQVNLPSLLYDRDGDNIVTVPEMAKVEIQVTYDGPGVVAKEYGADGTLRIVKECREGSVIVPVTGSGELVIVDNSKTFNDVNASDWYGEYVTFVTAREIFNGTGDGNFSPDATMTRAMLAQVLYNFARDSAAGDGTAFEDVNAADWFNAAIGWAYENGVVNGYGSRFGAQDNISRQDLATILYRFAKAAGYDVSKSASLDGFADAGDVAEYAKDAMRWAVGAGLINGTDGKLLPQQSATRAQVAAIMTRFVRGIR